MRLGLSLLLAGAAVACGGSAPSPGPTILPAPSGDAVFGEADLRLLLVDRFGSRWYCDPDEYPVAHGDELSNMQARWPDVLADATTLEAILAHEGLPPITEATLTDDQRIAVYRIWKEIASLPLELIGNGRYRFDYTAQPAAGAAQGTRSAGIVTDRGEVTIEQQAPADEPICPICLARGTPIDAPGGPVPVEDVRIGDVVWTLDLDGRRVPGTVLAVASTRAPADHVVIRVVLADGRSVTASPGHPLPDRRTVGDLRAGDAVDGSVVAEITRVPYGGGRTFDLVVSGSTGAYLAGGVALASTLAPPR